MQIQKTSIKIISAPPKSQAERLVRNQEWFNNFWKMSSFFSRCPVLNQQDLIIFSWLFHCPLRRLGCQNITQFLISFSISAHVLQRRQLMLPCWYCHLPSHSGIARSQKFRKWLLVFCVLAVTWCKHLPVTTIAFSIASFLYLCCSHWSNLSVGMILLLFFFLEREREREYIRVALLVSPGCFLLTQALFSACQQSHATLWTV